MNEKLTIERDVQFQRRRKGAKRIVPQSAPLPAPPPRLHRVTRLMALALCFDGLIRDGIIRDQAELARLGHVTRARISQIMNLLLLAPSIQEELLFLPPIERGRDPLPLADLQPIALRFEWSEQRRLWKLLLRGVPSLAGVASQQA